MPPCTLFTIPGFLVAARILKFEIAWKATVRIAHPPCSFVSNIPGVAAVVIDACSVALCVGVAFSDELTDLDWCS